MEPKKQLMETKKRQLENSTFGGVSAVKKTIDYTTIEIVSHPYLSVSLSLILRKICIHCLNCVKTPTNLLVNCQMRIFTNRGTFSNLLAL